MGVGGERERVTKRGKTRRKEDFFLSSRHRENGFLTLLPLSRKPDRSLSLLNLLHFFADDDGVGFADLFGPESVIVEGTFMLVGVAV